jgi:hypothetical protein
MLFILLYLLYSFQILVVQYLVNLVQFLVEVQLNTGLEASFCDYFL